MTTKIKSKKAVKSQSKLLTAMKNTVNTVLTENGAKTFDKTGSKVLDFYAKGAAMRSRTEADVLAAFRAAFDEDPLLALKTLFYIRDIRGGQGERNVVRIALKWLASSHSDLFIKNMDNIIKYGRFDDLFVAIGEGDASDAVYAFVKKQLGADSRQKDDGKLSLLAKWMPSINTSSAETRALAYKFVKYLKIKPKKYRQTLSKLRSRLNIVEKLISSNEWQSVNFSHVPSKANLLYKKAFSVHQPERYTAFIKSVQKGEAKMNASALYPYEIIRDISNRGGADSKALDAMWKSMPDFLKDNPHNGLVIADVSGSMCSSYGTTVSPIWVSVSLAIYFAQRTKGFFKDHFMEFTSESKLHKINSTNIVDAWNEVRSADWGGSTNLQAAFDQILNAAVSNKLPQSELPDVLYIISDMEFNSCTAGYGQPSLSNFEAAQRKFAARGYKLPTICFWNVAARNDQSPVTKDQSGATLVSGCSPSIFSQVISGKSVTPYDFMLETLNKDRYDSVVV